MSNFSVEIVLRKNVDLKSKEQIINLCLHYLRNNDVPVKTVCSIDDSHTISLQVQNIIAEGNSKLLNGTQDDIEWYLYTLNCLKPQMESYMSSDENNVNFALHYILPSAELHTLWENLIYEDNLKENLLKYAQTVMQFSKLGVNPNIISCNKVILLHGPPGTGKTSLCKAIAQKLSIRMQRTYSRSILIEIDSHSLFSKWYSESGKLITQMFERIQDAISIPDMFVCVLIDEVESLAQARDQLSNDPSDALKVVNAVLTHIDQLKRHPNVLILTTSNITTAIDMAFVDRADVKQYIGPPGPEAIFQIYSSCIKELMKVGIIENGSVSNQLIDDGVRAISKKSSQLSGRMLRKIPFLSHALLNKHENIPLEEFLGGMHVAIDRELSERKHFGKTVLTNGD